ncbi:hypothetical protein GCM10009414_15360 [Tatumella terrea]
MPQTGFRGIAALHNRVNPMTGGKEQALTSEHYRGVDDRGKESRKGRIGGNKALNMVSLSPG